MKQHWIGYFQFDPENSGHLKEKTVPCELILESDHEGGITGSFVNSDYQKAADAHVFLSGFIAEGFLSLVANFPSRLYYNEQGAPVLESDNNAHEMAFYGDLSEDGTEISGTWEIIEKTFLDLGSVGVYYSNGTFDVKLQAE